MRPHRVILVSAALASAMLASTAVARPHLPGLFGAVFGTVGGIVGLGHRHASARYHARHHTAPSRVATAPSAAIRAPDARTGIEKTEPPAARTTTSAANSDPGTAPLFWPSVYDDTFDYVFWPAGADDRFWTHGYGDIVGAGFRPAAVPALRTAGRHRRTQQTTGLAGVSSEPCTGQRNTQPADALIERIAQAIQPTDAQRPLLDELRAAALHALDYVDAACPADRPNTPGARLNATEDRLWAARQALMVTRAPVDTLYGALSDEQKGRLNGPASPAPERGAGCTQANVELPLGQMQPRGQPSAEQRAGIETLRKTSSGLAKLVAASCPASTPATPLQRLDLADRHLNAMLYAAVTLRAPLDAFASTQTRPESR